MKTFKLLDFWIQVILIAGSIVICIFFPSPVRFFGSYYLVGGWQLTSCLIHLLFRNGYYASRDRKFYLRTLLVLFLCSISLFIVPVIYGLLLLLISPMLAIWYASICYSENKMLKHKLLMHLK
jgi:hypothetical protein